MNAKQYAAPDGALFLLLMKLQLSRAYSARGEVMGKFFQLIKVLLLLATVAVCLLGYVLQHQSGIFREFQAVLLSLQWMLLVCLVVWCGTFLFLTFSRKDWPLLGLLLVAIVHYFTVASEFVRAADAIILLAGLTLGRGARALLSGSSRRESALTEKTGIDQSGLTSAATFLIGLIGLLAFSAAWHLDLPGAYHGPRWMGLWDNPNIYGMLMGAGAVLTVGLLPGIWSSEFGVRNYFGASSRRLLKTILFIASGMMAVGLFFSYSRGACVGTAMGFLYLAWCYGKVKWRFMLPVVLAVTAVVFFFWHSTADTDQWYLKRLDLSRPSAQHRVAAWRGAFQIMRDHPLGVGWNQAVGVYEKNYSHPEGGAAAITTNSYLMLGTELGLPGLLCFVAYVGLALKQKSGVRSQESESLQQIGNRKSESLSSAATLCDEALQLRCACRAGAVVLLVAFWFDGGLFDLPTASVFWILLELGTSDLVANRNCGASSSMNE